MLQTTENLLTFRQALIRDRQAIIKALTTAGYANIISTKYDENREYIVTADDSPIGLLLDLDQSYHVRNETQNIKLRDIQGYVNRYLCVRFSSTDVTMISKLYIHMLENNIQEIPYALHMLSNTMLEPGELAENITEYLNKEKTECYKHQRIN